MNILCRVTLLLLLLFLLLPKIHATACSSETLMCLDSNAECNEDGKCVCKPGFKGLPHLACHEDGDAFCTIASDPKGYTFAREPPDGLSISVPCKFPFAEVKTFRTDSRGECKIEVFVVQQRFLGKFYVSGFEAFVEYSTGRNTKGEISLRALGKASAGVYDYNLQTRFAFTGVYRNNANIGPLRDNLSGRSRFGADTETKMVDLEIEFCGLMLFFRAADDQLGLDQTYLPGISIAVDEQNNRVKYRKTNSTFCLSSDLDDTTVSAQTAMINTDSADTAFIFRALTGKNLQNVPSLANSECQAIQSLDDVCDDATVRKAALESCSFILENPFFADCFSTEEDSADLIQLLDNCIRSRCIGDFVTCESVNTEITTKGCEVKIDMDLPVCQ